MQKNEPLTIFLFRHGTTDYNREGRFSGIRDIGLTEEGQRECMRWLDRVREIPWEKVYSSPLKRALDSASILTGLDRDKITIMQDLIELDFGDWEGHRPDEIAARSPAEFNRWCQDPWHQTPILGETLTEAMTRIERFQDHLFSSHASGPIAIITHVIPIKLFVIRLLDLPRSSVFRLYLAPGSLSVVQSRATRSCVLRLWNWTDSLDNVLPCPPLPESL